VHGVPGLRLCALVLAASACASVSRVVHYERGGSFPMPDVAGKTADDARDALAAQGISATVGVMDEICHDFPDLAAERVCYTAPRAGAMTSATIPITLYVKSKVTASFEMPDLSGLTAEDARRKLASLGQNPDRVLIEPVRGEPPRDCLGDRICTQSPEAGRTAWVTGPVLLGLGPPGWTRKTATTAPTAPTAPTATTGAKPAEPPASSRPAAKPAKKDDAPAPVF
jgi:beta-lactam-binding protein with PASTA domain